MAIRRGLLFVARLVSLLLAAYGLIVNPVSAAASQHSRGADSSPEIVVTPAPTPVLGLAVQISSPSNKSTASGTVTIALHVGPQTHQVNVFVDGVCLGSTPPLSLTWDTTKFSNGPHLIDAEAFNTSGIFVGFDDIIVASNNVAPPTSTPTQKATATPTQKLTPTRTSTQTPTRTPTSTPTRTPALALSGQVQGGMIPITGSSVALYAAGTAYGSGATLLGSGASNGSGAFSVSFGCPAGNPQTYITASGGHAGNPAIGLMAALGPCRSLSSSTSVTINELTTAATQWALAQFLNSKGRVLGGPTSPPSLVAGLKNAYISFANLADINPVNLSVNGNPSSFLPSAASCAGGTPPVNCDALERLNTLADILAACVDSAGSSSTACATLMCDATPGLTYATSCSGTPAPTDTLGAAHLIVTNAANNVAVLFALATANKPFSPSLGATPDGWEIALNFAPAGASFNAPESLALDGSGNVFVANFNGESVSELTAKSNYASGLNFAPAGASFNAPESLALDGSGNVFVANFNGSSVSELTANSNYATGLNFAPAGASFNAPESLALDGSGNVFVANGGGNSVSELTAASHYATGRNFAPAGALLNSPLALALDASGNIFVANSYQEYSSVSELLAKSNYTTGLNFAPAAASFYNPFSLALDASGNVFVANDGGYGVSELTASSNYATGLNFAPGGASLYGAMSLALDPSGNVFVANTGGNSVSELTAESNYATGLNFAPAGASFSSPFSLALDASGNIFVANFYGSVSELLGLAKPVIMPVQKNLPP